MGKRSKKRMSSLAWEVSSLCFLHWLMYIVLLSSIFLRAHFWFFGLIDLDTSSFILSSKPAYSMRAPKTKSTQTITQASIAVSPSAFGMLLVMVLKMLTRTRNTVTRSVIRPGTISGGTRKLIQDTMTNMPEGR